MIIENIDNPEVSTHSRPKAAAQADLPLKLRPMVSTHSRPKAAAGFICNLLIGFAFQHTAARRRLHHFSLKIDH